MTRGHTSLDRPGTDDAHQHEASVSDRGVGQQTLHVSLGQTDDRADSHGRHGDHCEDDLPVPSHGAQTDVEHTHQTDEGDELGRHRHPAADRGRGSGVDVRSPGGKRNSAHLEQQSDGDQHHAGDDEP